MHSAVAKRNPFSIVFEMRFLPRLSGSCMVVLVDLSYLHNLILQLGEEEVHNLELLDGQRVQVDLLHAGDLAGLDETAELGDGLPLLLLLLSTTTATATTTTATVTTTTTVTTTVAARTETTTSTGSSVSHVVCMSDR